MAQCWVNITITASNGVLPNATQNFTLNVADFTISATPLSQTVYRDRLGIVILKLQSIQGFNGNVALSCAGGPAGSKCVDVPQVVQLHGTAYAFSGVVFPRNTRDGTYTVTFTAVSGPLTHSTTVKLAVK